MQNAFNHIKIALSSLYSPQELREICFLLAEKTTGKTRTQILTENNFIFSTKQIAEIQYCTNRLAAGEPVQYVLGETEFYGLTFKIRAGALIPRPETEELVELILKENQQITNNKILDIGTGSGCIAVALAKHLPESEVFAIDISEKALKIACENAKVNNVKVNFSKYNILTPHFSPLTSHFSIIVSNPPYIPQNEQAEMQVSVVDFEPHEALFVPQENPLIFYDFIAIFAKKHLAKNGKLYLEIHRNFGTQCVNLLQQYNFKHVRLHRDISGNDRMISANF